MDADEQQIRSIAFAGDIAKVQHGMYFVNVDYFYFTDKDFDTVQNKVQHYPAIKPFLALGNEDLQSKYSDQSCFWKIGNQLADFSQYADGIATDISAFMQQHYDLSISYFPNYVGSTDMPAYDSIQTCRHITQTQQYYSELQTAVSSIQYQLKYDVGFRRNRYRLSAWSKLPSPKTAADIIAPGQHIAIANDISAYALWIYQHTCAIQAIPANAGCIAKITSPSPNQTIYYDLSSTLHLEAFPAEWYVFDHWSIYGKSDVHSPTSFVLTADTQLTAYFKKQEFEVTIKFKNMSGSVECSIGTEKETIYSDKTFSTTHFDWLVFNAKNTIDTMFVKWESTDIAIENVDSNVLTLDNISSNVTIYVIFDVNAAAVNVERIGKMLGNVTINGIQADYQKVEFAGSATLVAQPHDYCKFVKWHTADNKDITASTLTLDNITKLTNVTAYFDTDMVSIGTSMADYDEPIIYHDSTGAGNIAYTS